MEYTDTTEKIAPCRLLTMQELEKISEAYCERTSGETKEYFRRRFAEQQQEKTETLSSATTGRGSF